MRWMRWMIFILLYCTMVLALRNPSAVYCEKLGYDYVINEGLGYCEPDDGILIEGFAFYAGEQGVEYGVCSKNGLETLSLNGTQYCEQSNGTVINVDDFMQLDLQDFFIEVHGICGDGKCALDENHKECPEDCEQSLKDMVCESYMDGVCDPDCNALGTPKADPDCVKKKKVTNQIPVLTPEPEREDDSNPRRINIKVLFTAFAMLTAILVTVRFIYLNRKRRE